jgi:PTH1 family peptidyl-tRNA hydrolase
VVARLAAEEGIRIRSREGSAKVGRGSVSGVAVLFALPQTYMNASGEAVRVLCQKNGIGEEDLCVVFDEVALPVGTLRMRAGGSAGGHKGMASVIAHLGTTEIPRLRVGVRGDRFSRERDLADYVLEPFSRLERERFEESVVRAVEALRIWLIHGIDAAMRHANGKPSSPAPQTAPD